MKRYFLALFFLIILGVVVISDEFELLELSGEKKLLIEKIFLDKYTTQVVLDGKITFKILPLPYLEIPDIKILYENETISNLHKVTFHFNFKNLFTSSESHILTSNNTIKVKRAWLNLENIMKYINVNGLDDKLDFHLNVDYLDVNFTLQSEETINLISQDFKFQINNNLIQNSGLLTFNKHKFHYNYSVLNNKTDNDIDFKINTSRLFLNLHLQAFNYTNLSLKNGSITLNVKDENNPTNISTDSFNADIVSNGSGEIALNNTSFKGSILNNPKVIMKLYKVANNIFELQILIDIAKINITPFVDSELCLENLDLNETVKVILAMFPDREDFNMNLQLQLGKIIFGKHNIHNMNLHAYSVGNRTIIKRFSAHLPGESEVMLAGIIYGNEFRRKFYGFLNVESKDYTPIMEIYSCDDVFEREKLPLKVSTVVLAMPNIVKLSNMSLESNKIKTNSNIVLHKIPYDKPLKRISIQAEELDLNKVGFSAALSDNIRRLYDADEDKSGEMYFKLTNANNWIRRFFSDLHIDAELNNLTLYDQTIDYLNAMIELKSQVLNIKKFQIDDKNIQGNLSFKFVLPVLRPQIALNANLEKLNWNFYKGFILKSDENRNINFFSANNYDGNFNIKVKELVFDDQNKINNLESKINLKLGYLLVEDLNFALWNGSFKANAGIVISSHRPIFSLRFNIYNINPGQMLKLITNVDKMTGYMSLAGIINGQLKTFDDLYKIYGQADFEGAAIQWNGLGLNNIIDVVDGDYTVESKLKAIDYYKNYGEMLLDSLKGSMMIKNGLVQIGNATINSKRIAGVYSLNYELYSKAISGAGAFAFIPTIGSNNNSIVINTQTYGTLPNPQINDVNCDKVIEFVKSNSQ